MARETDQLIAVSNEFKTERLLEEKIKQETMFKIAKSNSCRCRLCGLGNEGLLQVSYSKPWVACTTFERLDPYNAFLFCVPHGLLYDKGYISLNNNGQVLLSSLLDHRSRTAFNISEGMGVVLSKEQHPYVEYHRVNTFLE